MAEWFNAQNDWILNRVEDDDAGSLRMMVVGLRSRWRVVEDDGLAD
jgi:hypothetical protein